MSTRLLRANSSARDGVSKSSRFSLPSIWRTISASSRRLENRSSTIRTVLRWARANASSETTPDPGIELLGWALIGSPLPLIDGTMARPVSKKNADRLPRESPAEGSMSRADKKTGPNLQDRLTSTWWSGREDSNFRPPAPHAGALPGCATPRPNRELYASIGHPSRLAVRLMGHHCSRGGPTRSWPVRTSPGDDGFPQVPAAGRSGRDRPPAERPRRSLNWSGHVRQPGVHWPRIPADGARH